MARAFSPKVVTANALLEGDVIYLTADGMWVRDMSAAALFTDEEAANAALASVKGDNQLVGPYLFDAKAGENGPEAVHFREDFRRTGPSNYFHGKQADPQA
ncbi:hypothetical protein AQS8620_02562 [Aquimixticola soesokkakensis]|uniref:Uncharacterized protein n=1 Tax=Aquimixticola soesokkakensis TaxID=1519096 RepID=A0A1Y5T7F7_9RHOB|nr:DUF2849 domain-containing protein [Aquimixticola soesokkakensis]SLN57625.1 hypothetical protein AQS8620_02562 [Aquimixticola soesokkakensis]